MKNKLLTTSALLCCSIVALTGCKRKRSEREITIRNMYFASNEEIFEGTDPYTEFIEEKFDVEISPSYYNYSDWGSQVMGEINSVQTGETLPDVFHFDLESFNYGNTYKTWAEGGIIKALPDDLSKWPKVKQLIDNSSNIESLKINGKLYGIPIAYDPFDPSKDFSSFTYIYRRDWVKLLDLQHCHDGVYDAGYPLLRDNDEYTFEEFLNIIKAFGTRADIQDSKAAAIGDINWGFPSLTNFFKDSPHCYSVNNGVVSNAFTTEGYRRGLDETVKLITAKLYYDQPSHTNDEKAVEFYQGGHLGILYDNHSYGNYSKLRKTIKNVVPGISEADLNDRTAFMKVYGIDDAYHLEGSENWFSMTFFNNDISDNKQKKVLDIMEFLLSEEGTRLAIFGKENQDYVLVDGEPETLWEKKKNGEYPNIVNGAKFLRKMLTLGYDTTEYDPFTDQSSYQIVKNWDKDIAAKKAAGKLVTFQEPAKVKWLTTEKKDMYTSSMIKEGNDTALNYCYGSGGITSWAKYTDALSTAKWTETIAEINHVLGN